MKEKLLPCPILLEMADYYMQIINKIKRISSYYLSNNFESFLFIFLQAIVFGLFLQLALFNDFVPFFSLYSFLIFGFSIIVFFLMWICYSLVLSKIYLGRFSRGAISEILKYDSYSYFPLTILLLLGLILQYIELLTNFLIWFFLIGLILVVLLKIIIFICRPPRKDISTEEMGWQAKQKIIEKVTDLDPDNHIAKMYKVDDKHPVRKYIADDELRNAINIKNSKKGKITFEKSKWESQIIFLRR